MGEAALECEVADGLVVVRQPIFDRDKSVWGYELIVGDSPDGDIAIEGMPLSDLVTAHLQSLSTCCAEMVGGKKLFLNINNEELMCEASMPSGWDNCVFGVCGGAAESAQCTCFADSLHEQGGCVAIDGDMDTCDMNRIDKFDIVKISLAGRTPHEIVGIRQKFKGLHCEFLATEVANWEAYEGTRALGFKYFQGPFFAVPDTRNNTELSPGSVAKLQLLKELNDPACEMDQLAQIIANDVALSYRILKYINAASFGLKNNIKSIQQAVSLLGLNELKHWATVVVMADLDSSPKGEELAYLALQRARFLSELAGSLKGFNQSPNTMFMLGLFSKLDALLSYSMDKALEGIPLDDDIKAGLCGTLNEYRDWLLMLEAVEIGNWQIANDILARYGACFTEVATQYMQAASWAARQLPEMKN